MPIGIYKRIKGVNYFPEKMGFKKGHKMGLKHGMCETATYYSWANMRNRCTNKKLIAYKDYGGRGIRMCDRWKKFENFYKDMGEKPVGLTLDRIDNGKGYCKENCKWSTRKEQMNNTRHNHYLTYNGKTQNMKQWSEEMGIKYSILVKRINVHKWEIERALTEEAGSFFNKSKQTIK